MQEYELAGIEVIARGVAKRGGKVLLCKAKSSTTTYLPGGHVEFGEKARQALVREVREEMGIPSAASDFLGVVENSFTQHGKPHAEVNLVYKLVIDPSAPTVSQEDWIEFLWWDVADIASARLLPSEMIPIVQSCPG
ncbi:MAG: NUDIX domain-containing protein [Kiritimatiellae bacterium]|nr:NUDIX domain-containing protein [Kiritimatiellia bacterium]